MIARKVIPSNLPLIEVTSGGSLIASSQANGGQRPEFC